MIWTLLLKLTLTEMALSAPVVQVTQVVDT